MAVQVEAAGQPTAADRPWYARSPDEVTAALHVDPAVGLTAARAGELLSANGPNALPDKDIIAGVVPITLLIPQGMADAELAGLPRSPACTPPSWPARLCGASPAPDPRAGPDSSLGPMIAATILPLIGADGDAKRPARRGATRSG